MEPRKKQKSDGNFLGLELDTPSSQKLNSAIAIIRQYNCLQLLEHQKSSISSVKQHISQFQDRLTKITECSQYNALFLKHMIGHAEDSTEPADNSRIGKLLLDIAREWSAECAQERNYIHTVKEMVLRHLPNCKNILVPGFRTGRILFELSLAGYNVQGNEQDYIHFLAANFLLNKCTQRVDIYPYLYFTNNLKEQTAFHPVNIPDMLPQQQKTKDIHCSVGDFIRLYRFRTAQWDSIVTCFYIDKVKNIILLVRLIKQLLGKGGVWINYGTLSFEGAEIEVTYEQLMEIVRHEGLKVEEEGREKNKMHYSQEKMLNVHYDCVYFAARKPHN